MFHDPALRKAKASVAAAGNFTRRERMFISRHKVECMLAWSESNEELRKYALLFLLSYSFLLRTPSEALPAIAGTDGSELGSNSVLFKNGDQLVLVLRRRKNKPAGSRLARRCTCNNAANACAFHLIGSLLDTTPVGTRLFEGITASGALAYSDCAIMLCTCCLCSGATTTLRILLEAVGTQNAHLYRPHDLRRGHAEDLRLSGAPLWKILAAGEWRSPAFLNYMDIHKMEIEMVMQGCLDEESDCDVDTYVCAATASSGA